MNLRTIISSISLLLFVFLFGIPSSVSAQACPNASDNPCWETKSPMPTARRGLGVTSDSLGRVFAVGGHNGGFLATFEMYDPITDSWTTKSSLPAARHEMGFTTASNGKMYVVGGYNEGFFNDTYEYDPITDIWVAKSPMPTARIELGLTAGQNGKLYAIGGQLSDGTATGVVEEYDPVTDQWTTKSSMPTPRIALGIVAAPNGKIYAIGGHLDSSGNSINVPTVEEYDPVLDSWATKSPMPTARSLMGASVNSADNIYAIGGDLGDGSFTNVVEEYNPITDVWMTRTSLPIAIRNFGLALGGDGKVYAIGGQTADGANQNTNYAGTPFVSVPRQLTALSPAQVWIGLKNSDDVGVRFDLLAEVYKDNVLVSSGQVNSVAGGSSGFNNARLDVISFNPFVPVDFPQGSQLSIKLYVRNACVGSTHNSGVARLWFNDSAANSHFDATIDATTNDYFLRDGFLLATTPGSGPKKTVDVQSGARCSAFKSFGTWTITP